MNERLRILKLLEEGKINADEAARLLEALNHSDSREKRGHFWGHMESIPDMVTTAIASSFKHMQPEEKLEIPAKKRIQFRGISGDLEIVGADVDKIKIEKDGYAKITEENDTLKIKAISGDLKITVPKKIDLAIMDVSGDIEVSDTEGTIELSSVSGDIEGKNLAGSFTGEVVSGDIDLDYIKVEKIMIKAKSGDITLALDDKIGADIEVRTEDGDIDCDLKLTNETREDNHLKGTFNEPKAKIEIRDDYGDVSLKKRN